MSNYIGLTGFDFIEFGSKDPEALVKLFKKLGFSKTRRNEELNIDYYNQGDIHFLCTRNPE